MSKQYAVRNISFFDHYVPIIIAEGTEDEVSVRARATVALGADRRVDKRRLAAHGLSDVIQEYELEVVEVKPEADTAPVADKPETTPAPAVTSNQPSTKE